MKRPLRANYLWPAMWGKAFGEDDPESPRLADEYGIVMGASHVEPMMRADVEWNRLGHTEKDWNYQTHPKELEKFWTDGVVRDKPYENVVTIAMRGKVGTPMSETANIRLLETIVAKQREILAQNVNPDVTRFPRFGASTRRCRSTTRRGCGCPTTSPCSGPTTTGAISAVSPPPQERLRKGGAGVYYHFDYVGGPRNYKWLDTNPIAMVWEQMNLARKYGADRVWIVNVGDLKPMEFFLTMARDPDAIKKEDLQRYTERWAAREFGEKHTVEIARIISETGRLNGRRKPELLSPETYSAERLRRSGSSRR